MKLSDRLSTLVFEASNLRDYLLHVEGLDSDILGNALRPFERSNAETEPTDKEIAALSRAFQSSYDDVVRRVDNYTIGEVLNGRSPQKQRTPILSVILLSFVGLLLVFIAFTSTLWANRATIAVNEAEEFVKFDHGSRLTRLIELKNYFEQTERSDEVRDLEPQLIYLEGISTLRSHYLEERTLPDRMNRLLNERPLMTPVKAVHSTLCTWSEGESDRAGYAQTLLGCPKQTPADDETQTPAADEDAPDQEVMADEDTPNESDGAVSRNSANWFDVGFERVSELESLTMEQANRLVENLYQDSRHAVRIRIQNLREDLNTVHLWYLPIVYGMLGSIVYCLWRVLNPNIAPLGVFYTFTRTMFAGLAALTLSMLLVPSNILTAGVELNRPLIYLLSFIFGYSVEVFINTLDLLNRYFQSSISTRPRSAEK